MNNSISPLSRSTALLLSLLSFFGICGIHRFYAGRPITGILQLITVGFFGLWQLIDIICLIFGCFRDGDGRVMK